MVVRSEHVQAKKKRQEEGAGSGEEGQREDLGVKGEGYPLLRQILRQWSGKVRASGRSMSEEPEKRRETTTAEAEEDSARSEEHNASESWKQAGTIKAQSEEIARLRLELQGMRQAEEGLRAAVCTEASAMSVALQHVQCLMGDAQEWAAQAEANAPHVLHSLPSLAPSSSSFSSSCSSYSSDSSDSSDFSSLGASFLSSSFLCSSFSCIVSNIAMDVGSVEPALCVKRD